MKKTQFWWYLTGKLVYWRVTCCSTKMHQHPKSWRIYVHMGKSWDKLQLPATSATWLQLVLFSTFLVAYKKPLTVGYLQMPKNDKFSPSFCAFDWRIARTMLRCGGQVEDFCNFAFLVETNSKVLNTISIYEHSVWRRMTSVTKTSNMYRCFGRYTRIYLRLTAKFHTFRFLSHSSQSCSSFFRMFTKHLESPPKIDGRKFRLTFFQADFSPLIWSRPIYLLVNVELSSTLLEKHDIPKLASSFTICWG